MNRKLHIPFVSVILTLCPVIALLFCAGCSRHQPAYHIGVSQCLDDAWRQKMNAEMEREALLHPNMQLMTRCAYASSALQCAQIDSFIREDVDLLIISPMEAEAVKPAVTRAYQAGIPVIVADRRISGDQWTAFVGGDNYEVGQLLAAWALRVQSETPHPLKILEVCGMQGSTPEQLRHRGLTETLMQHAPAPVLCSVQGDVDAYTAVRQFLREHKDVDVIVAHNDRMAIEAARALRDTEGYRPVRIMGVDGNAEGLQAIADGVIECTAIYPSRGDLMITTAAQILAGEPYVRDTVLPTTMVDAATARAMLMQHAERDHDLEIFRIVRLNADTRWQQMRTGKVVLITIIVLVILLFLAALGGLAYLQLRIQSKIKDEVLPQLENVEEAIQLSHRDEAFVERMRQVVDAHLTDPDLTVEYLGSMLQLSRTQLFRKVKTITGKGPLDFIRERRLIRADELLHTTDMTVRQVALELCFNSPGYFSKCYKDYFGHLPSKAQ